MRCVTTDARLDSHFTTLDVSAIEDVALSQCRRAGASYAAVRLHQVRSRVVHLRDLELETAVDHRDLGVGIRVIGGGAWGFASTSRLDTDAVRDAARRACELAKQCSRLGGPEVSLAHEPSATGIHISDYATDPFTVPMDEMAKLYAAGKLDPQTAAARAA